MEKIIFKTMVSGYKENNNWFGANYNMNIYRGCNHGCIYCDSRSECYGIERFDEVRDKENALEMIERDLRRKRRKGVVGTGAMSDPYNPLEKEKERTRGGLELIHKYRFGVAIATKSDLVVRDMDLLKKIQTHSPVLVKITITCAEDALGKKVEKQAPLSSKRFDAIRELRRNDIFAGVLMMPILPFIEDSEENIRGILTRAADADARFIYPAFGVTLRGNQRDWFYNNLDRDFPGIRRKYEAEFGDAYECHSPKGKQLYQLFKEECRRKGILYRMEDIITAYKENYGKEQLSFLDG